MILRLLAIKKCCVYVYEALCQLAEGLIKLLVETEEEGLLIYDVRHTLPLGYTRTLGR